MSMRAAINAKCKDCIYDSCAPGNWRQQVESCTIITCSLHPYRPKSRGTKGKDCLGQKAPELATELGW